MHDNWLQGVSKTDIEKVNTAAASPDSSYSSKQNSTFFKQAKAAHNRQIARAEAQQALSDQYDTSDANQLWLNALKYLQSGETIFSVCVSLSLHAHLEPYLILCFLLQAIQRWGGAKKGKTSLADKWKKKKKSAMDVDEAQEVEFFCLLA